MARRQRDQGLVTGLIKLLALIAVAGGAGLALGIGLTQLSEEDDGLSATAPVTGTATPAATATTATTTRTATVAAPATTTATTGPAPTTTTPAQRPAAQVRLRVLGAILRPAGTPSGRRRQRARLIMRVRAQNAGDRSVTLGAPILRVGKVRVAPDPAANPADGMFGDLPAGETNAVTLRYEVGGDATRKLTRDRRARLEVGGQSIILRVRIGAPVRPSDEPAAP